ncbi:MAG: hypothetical protein LBV69_09005 [Bacteroidales bacterium]|jgi:hypothetical protein|nr:hypothetical protein [Bacteroidales bacterium]
MENELILEIPYGGLGDNLFFSHIPRIAKESGKYDKVLISKHSLERHPDNTELVWKLNPFVDGFSEEHGQKIVIDEIIRKIENTTEINILDYIMLEYGLDNGKRWNEPEIYYKPKFITKYNKTVYDPNYLSWIGNVTKEDFMTYFLKNNINFDVVMKIRTEKVMFVPNEDTVFIETASLKDFCDLIFSTEKLFCLTSGTATIASALGKKVIAFYGEGQSKVFHHSKNNEYVFIPRYFMNKYNRLKRKFFANYF